MIHRWCGQVNGGTPIFAAPRFLFASSARKRAHVCLAPDEAPPAASRKELEGRGPTQTTLKIPPHELPLESLIREMAAHRLRTVPAGDDDGLS